MEKENQADPSPKSKPKAMKSKLAEYAGRTLPVRSTYIMKGLYVQHTNLYARHTSQSLPNFPIQLLTQ